MKIYALLSVALFSLLLLGSCAGTPSRAPMVIESFGLLSEIPLDFVADKVVYHAQSQMLIGFSSKNQEIHIFKGSKRQNIIGGLGANFNYLSDIALGQDGSIYALDSASRKVKKYSLDGKAIGTQELGGCVQPTLIAVQSDQSLFIYDAGPGEIICYSAIDGTEQNRFGRFQLTQISSLASNRDYLVAYSKDSDSSVIFSTLGQMVRSETGQVVYDVYNNGIGYQKGGLISLTSAAFLPLRSEPKQLVIDRDVLVLGYGESARLFKIKYLQVK